MLNRRARWTPRFLIRGLLAALLAAVLPLPLIADDKGASFRLALESITSERLGEQVDYVAHDHFEGREAGSRGGRAIGDYLASELQRLNFTPAGSDGYFQPFGQGYRNVLGLLPGRDPVLKNQIVLVGGHYDHVGYGQWFNSLGPVGQIHNGADDNGSGTCGVLSVAQALRVMHEPPRRSILVVFWDAEEKGLLGSKHWIAHPTLPPERLALVINVDMIGRLRNDRLQLFGSRTSAGLRRLVSLQNDESDLEIAFDRVLKPNGDHFTFQSRNIPGILFHTGEHENYHRPSDKSNLINRAGMERITRLLFKTLWEAAETTDDFKWREMCRNEAKQPAARETPGAPRLSDRLGALWQTAADNAGVQLTWIYAGSPAEKAALRVGDRLLRIDGRAIVQNDDVLPALHAARNPVVIEVQRPGTAEPLSLTCTLDGNPMRLGIVWKTDDGEPACVVLTHVMAGSPADRAGLRVGDRIYRLGGRDVTDDNQFAELIRAASGAVELLVERDGKLHVLTAELTPTAKRAA